MYLQPGSWERRSRNAGRDLVNLAGPWKKEKKEEGEMENREISRAPLGTALTECSSEFGYIISVLIKSLSQPRQLTIRIIDLYGLQKIQ